MVRPVPPRRRRSSNGPELLANLLVEPRARALPIPPYAWWRAVGPRVAERARPTRLRRGELLVCVASPTWGQELSFLAPTICERLQKLGYPVEKLRFYVGQVEPPLRRPEPAPPKWVPPPAKLPPPLMHSLSRVDDDGLREAIARAAAANLAWQKLNEPRPGAPTLRFAGRGIAPPGHMMPRAPVGPPRKP